MQELVEGDVVTFTNGCGLYTDVNNMTPYAKYELQETPEQEIWPMSNGGSYKPEMKLAVLNDRGKLMRLNRSRFASEDFTLTPRDEAILDEYNRRQKRVEKIRNCMRTKNNVKAVAF